MTKAVRRQHEDLFPDVPRGTTAIVHDIDVGAMRPIKQHSYRMNPHKPLPGFNVLVIVK